MISWLQTIGCALTTNSLGWSFFARLGSLCLAHFATSPCDVGAHVSNHALILGFDNLKDQNRAEWLKTNPPLEVVLSQIEIPHWPSIFWNRRKIRPSKPCPLAALGTCVTAAVLTFIAWHQYLPKETKPQMTWLGFTTFILHVWPSRPYRYLPLFILLVKEPTRLWVYMTYDLIHDDHVP